jgi:hypothetical protein
MSVNKFNNIPAVYVRNLKSCNLTIKITVFQGVTYDQSESSLWKLKKKLGNLQMMNRVECFRTNEDDVNACKL